MAPKRTAITSFMMSVDQQTTVASEGTPQQFTSSSTPDATSVISAALTGATDDVYVGHAIEALNGNCKGQKVLVTEFTNGSDDLTVTDLNQSSPSSTQWKHIELPWSVAPSTTNGSTTTYVSADRNGEADDTWNGYQLLMLKGANTDQVAISDFTGSSGTFTHATATSTTVGDLAIPVQPLKVEGVGMVINGKTPIERELSTEYLDMEAPVFGAPENHAVTFAMEVRGIATAAGNAVAATAPVEAKAALGSIYSEVLITGDDAAAGGAGTATAPILEETTATFAAYSMGLMDGDLFGVTAIASNSPVGDNTLTVPAGHLSNTPTIGNIAYGAACYSPVDTGHKTCSFLGFMDGDLLGIVSGALPSHTVTIEPNAVAKHNFSYTGLYGLYTKLSQPHSADTYDNSTPVVAEGTVGRIVIDGTAMSIDLLSAEFRFMGEPVVRNGFGTIDNKGGICYQGQDFGCTLTFAMDDADFFHRPSAEPTFDFLFQMGSVATATFGVWATQAKYAAATTVDEADGKKTVTVNLRFTKPTDNTKPSWVMAVA